MPRVLQTPAVRHLALLSAAVTPRFVPRLSRPATAQDATATPSEAAPIALGAPSS